MELVARELLTSAYDRAIERECAVQLSLSHPTTVLNATPWLWNGTFIEELFATECADDILDCVPSNIEVKTTFREAFGKSKVRSTHVGKMIYDSGKMSDAAWAALIRGMAMIVATRVSGMDFSIFLYQHYYRAIL